MPRRKQEGPSLFSDASGEAKRVEPGIRSPITPELAARLTKEDIQSLEAARAHSLHYNPTRASIEVRLSDQALASLNLVGLSEWEIDLCHQWAGLEPAGVSEECRYAQHVLGHMPLLNRLGMLDKQQFWDQMGLAERLTFFWDARYLLDRTPEPKTVLGQIALKVIHYWRGFAEANWPTANDLYWALQGKNSQAPKRKRPGSAKTAVGLAAIWRLALHLERAWHGRGHRPTINPEHIYEALGDLQGQVEVDCWTRDDDTMLELLKKTGHADGCSFCDLYSLDSFEFGWGSGFGGSGISTTSCPRCSGRLMEKWSDKVPESPQASRWDGGPTVPERGDYAYRWAVKHGMMWDEFLQKVRGLQTGFDPAKKVLCPLLEHCNTRCAQDQKAGVRGWPLGSSDYETSCYKFREVLWCRGTGGTPEQFEALQKMQQERRNRAEKSRARREPRPAKATQQDAATGAQEGQGPRQGSLF